MLVLLLLLLGLLLLSLLSFLPPVLASQVLTGRLLPCTRTHGGFVLEK
jgi:hypothetical protein